MRGKRGKKNERRALLLWAQRLKAGKAGQELAEGAPDWLNVVLLQENQTMPSYQVTF